MDLPRMMAMNRHWRRNPPLRLMVQAYLGIQPPAANPDASEGANTEQDLNDFIQLFSASGGAVG